MRELIEKFLSSEAFAVAGASNNRQKFGNKVLRCYLQHDKRVYAINPNETEVEGVSCFARLSELPPSVKSISIVTPPSVTEKIVEQAIKAQIQNIWMQPGAESELAIKHCKEQGINVIAKGPCILVELGFKD